MKNRIKTSQGILDVYASTERCEQYGFNGVDISFQFWVGDTELKKIIRDFEKNPSRDYRASVDTKELYSFLESEKKNNTPQGGKVFGNNPIHSFSAFQKEINRIATERLFSLYDMQSYDCCIVKNERQMPGYSRHEINPTAKAVAVYRNIRDFRCFPKAVKKLFSK